MACAHAHTVTLCSSPKQFVYVLTSVNNDDIIYLIFIFQIIIVKVIVKTTANWVLMYH